jgi:hypothetical protein
MTDIATAKAVPALLKQGEVLTAGGLPQRAGVNRLEVALAKARHTLVRAGRVEDRQIELERLANPVTQGRVIGQIVVRQRMDQRAQYIK